MKHIKLFEEYLLETVQLADKIYFKTGELNEEEKELVLDVTHGDNYTKFIADVLHHLKAIDKDYSEHVLRTYYLDVKNYDKNVFPIKGFGDVYDINHIDDNIFNFLSSLNTRSVIIKNLKELPSVAIRNMKEDIRKPRTSGELSNYKDNLEYFFSQISLLSNRDEKSKEIITKKMFRNNTTLDKMINFADEKSNLIGGEGLTKEDIVDIVKDGYSMDIIYDVGDVMVIRVDDPSDIKKLGCNSLWCFTYGGNGINWNQWHTFSTNSIIYVIIDFREIGNEHFMNVVIKPMDYKNPDENEEKIFDMTNSSLNSPIYYLKHTLTLKVAKKLLTFKYE